MKKTIFNYMWWDKVLTRMLYTGAEAALAGIGTGLVGIAEIDFTAVLSLAAGGALSAMLFSLADLRQDDDPYTRKSEVYKNE